MTLDETKKQLHDLKPVLKAKYKVETIEIFGSYARRGQTPQSDIDLLVTYSEAPDIVGVNNIKRLLRRKLGVKVDIVSKKYINPLIKEKILKEAIPV
ncbi:MAG TPA: nucleotidyltransferase family protein [Candidatus Bathyarchaeia archaeon]|jgi:predicted nucleotidyltransferase